MTKKSIEITEGVKPTFTTHTFETPYTKKPIKIRCKDNSYDLDTVKQVISKRETGGEYFNKFDLAKFHPNQVWADLGGHIGSFAIRMAMQFGVKVHTFEPTPKTNKQLVKNIALNGLEDNIIAHQVAVTGGATGECNFYINRNSNSGVNSILEKRGRDILTVQCENINEVYKDRRFNCLKLDVEGAEYDILKSFKYLHKMEVLLLEYHFNQIKDVEFQKYFETIDKLKENFDEVIYLEEPKKHWNCHVFAFNNKLIKKNK